MPELRTKPHIRFAGFNDDWEQRKVGDLAEQTYGGGTPTTSVDEYWAGNIPWIQSSDLTENEVFGVTPKKHISSKGLNASATKLIPENSIAIITRVGVGKLAFMPFSYASSQDFLSLSKLKLDGLFAVYALYEKLQSELNIVQGTSIKGITKEELLTKTIMIPNTTEQTKIGQLFAALDRLITLHQREYSKTANIKKAMLKKMFPKNGEDKPEIRFAGFTDAWEQRKFDFMFDPIPNNTLSRAALNYDSGEIKSVHYGDILIKYGAVTNCQIDEIPFITGGDVSDYKNNLLCNGDILIADAAEDETVGKCTEIVGIDGNSVVSGLHTVACRPKVKMQPHYLGYYMNAPSYHCQLLPLMQGIKVLSISRSNLAKTTIAYPVSEEEQRHIGSTFATLDRLITLHQRELTKLQNVKKSLLEKMFPPAGRASV